ncbi:MAG: BamA/TamA family outer membrane protein, partial [Bacteroidia bacterium]|nr:BamA/TamA family outer membrane protein [Bacteroidia bacterium]
LTFNNFSLKNIGKKSAWRPLPTGDGQKLSIQAQSNGIYFQSYNLSFTEPWFGGKAPNSFTVSGFYSVQSNGLKRSDSNRQSIAIGGATIGFGKRLKWPDDYFLMFGELIYQNYSLKNYQSLPQLGFSTGAANQASLRITFSRNSVNGPIYPFDGMNISLTGQFTPPISLFTKKDYSEISGQDKFRWLEFHKYKFKFAGYQRIVDKLVIATRVHMGLIGLYNRQLGLVPFERFYLGGDGLSGYSLDGREIIALRGYANNSLVPIDSKLGSVGGTIYNKYTMELRYPVSLNPSATIFGYGFVEAGRSWAKWDGYNPFNVYRSAGVGVRVFLPMFGLLGVDWGYGFDPVLNNPGVNGSHFHFSIGMNFEQ